ncbi:MAG: hypothetical protein KAG61_09565 [Bacteriovoracaceae bacterium]|nr:hypothetical protein [Bacteriovoracaceae bacterium]
MKKHALLFLIPLLVCNAFSAQIGYGTSKSVETQGQAQDSDWLSLSFDSKFKKRRYQGFMDADVRLYTGSSNYLYSIPEAFIGHRTRHSTISVGRKIVDWNSADAVWELGNINGMQGFNLLGDKQEGLFGLHAERELSKNWNIKFYGSALYVPSLNPGYEVKGGKVTSNTPWMSAPPSQMRMNGVDTPINYELGQYSVSDIIFQESLGGNLAYSWGGGAVSVYGMYKPENKLRINAEGKLSKDAKQVNVAVSPKVNHHFIYGVGVNQKVGRKVQVSGGLEIIDPNSDLKSDLGLGVVNPTLIKNNKRDFNTDYIVVEPSYQRQSYLHMGAKYVSSICKMGVNYLYNLAERSGDAVFGDAVKWHNAVGVSVDYDFNDNLSMLFDFKYDMEMGDNVIKKEVSYRFLNQMSIAVGLELLKAPRDDSYWSAYRENDTVYSNFGYSF